MFSEKNRRLIIMFNFDVLKSRFFMCSINYSTHIYSDL